MVTTTELPAEVEGWAREIHGDTESLVRPDGMRTYSLKRRRFYDRRFNHDRARALHADGTSYRRIANQLGVSENSILFAVDVDARARAQKLSKAFATRTCEQCFGRAHALPRMPLAGDAHRDPVQPGRRVGHAVVRHL